MKRFLNRKLIKDYDSSLAFKTIRLMKHENLETLSDKSILRNCDLGRPTINSGYFSLLSSVAFRSSNGSKLKKEERSSEVKKLLRIIVKFQPCGYLFIGLSS